MIKFKNRVEAAEKLVDILSKFKGTNTIILGIPRGGIITANVVAKNLNLPFGIVVVRKIGHPDNSEFAVAAISESGLMVKNKEEVDKIDKNWFIKEAEKQLLEAKRRRIKYSGKRRYLGFKNRTVVLVDDGLATGLTMEAAIKEVKIENPKKIIVAVPISQKDTADRIKKEVDEFIACSIPSSFEGAVGAYYEDFPQVNDGEVIKIMRRNDPIFFYMPEFKSLAQEISRFSNYEMGNYELTNFDNKELKILINTKIKNMPAIFLGDISPPPEKLWETFLVCDTLRKEGASKIWAILPYMAYTRHDKNKPKEDLAIKLIANIFEKAGVDKIITVDIHSEHAFNFFKILMVSLSPSKLFTEKIKELKFEASIVVAPDEGALKRAELVKHELNVKNKLVVFAKHRESGCNSSSLICDGKIVGEKAIIVDDILDTGQTLINCAKELHKNGIKEILVVVTHGLFTGEKWKQLFDYGVTKIITTDSVYSAKKKASDKIIVLPVSTLFKETLK